MYDKKSTTIWRTVKMHKQKYIEIKASSNVYNLKCLAEQANLGAALQTLL